MPQDITMDPEDKKKKKKRVNVLWISLMARSVSSSICGNMGWLFPYKG